MRRARHRHHQAAKEKGAQILFNPTRVRSGDGNHHRDCGQPHVEESHDPAQSSATKTKHVSLTSAVPAEFTAERFQKVSSPAICPHLGQNRPNPRKSAVCSPERMVCPAERGPVPGNECPFLPASGSFRATNRLFLPTVGLFRGTEGAFGGTGRLRAATDGGGRAMRGACRETGGALAGRNGWGQFRGGRVFP